MTDRQIDMLCEMSEIHLEWFRNYSPDNYITFEEVLQLNHVKMMSIIENCSDCSEEMIDFIFEAIIEDYKEMLEDESETNFH